MQKNIEYLNRFVQMLTNTQLDKLFSARIILFGAGGVGWAVAHFLARAGIQNLDVVDFDTIDITNINRQLVAYQNNVGKLKVDELQTQLKNINPNLNINIFPIKYGEETKHLIDLSNYDYVIDCIDDVNAKKLLIKTAKAQNKYIICAMGAGNRYKEIPQFEVVNISKTSYDPLAKIIRKFCLEEGIKTLDVCYTKQKPVAANALKSATNEVQKQDNLKSLNQKPCKNISSVVYYPISMACAIVAHIINKIVKE